MSTIRNLNTINEPSTLSDLDSRTASGNFVVDNATSNSTGDELSNDSIKLSVEQTRTLLGKFQTTLSDSAKVPNTIGGILKDTTVASLKSKTISEIIVDMLIPTEAPTYTEPTASLTLNGGGNRVREVGESYDVTLAASFTTNDSGGLVSDPYLFKKDTGGGFSDLGSAQSSNSYNESLSVIDGVISYKCNVSYSAGTQKTNNKGELQGTPIAAGDVDTETHTVTGKYKVFYGTVAAPLTNATDPRLLTNFLSSATTLKNIDVNLSEGTAAFELFLPPERTLSSITSTAGEDITSSPSFSTDNSYTVNDAGETGVTYTKHTFNPPLTYSSKFTIVIT